MKHQLDIDRNAEGEDLAVLAPIKRNGSIDCGYRISGPKAWGGSTTIARLTISDSDLVRYIKDYAPHLIKKLKD